MTLGPEWRPHPRRDGFYVDEGRPGYMRDRAGNWYVDEEEAGWWYRDQDGRVVWLEAPKEPSAAERQSELAQPSDDDFADRFRRRLRERRAS